MDQITVTASCDIEGVTVIASATVPSDGARRNPEALIYGFEVYELHNLAGCVAAELPALLGSVAAVVQESLIAVVKSRKSSE